MALLQRSLRFPFCRSRWLCSASKAKVAPKPKKDTRPSKYDMTPVSGRLSTRENSQRIAFSLEDITQGMERFHFTGLITVPKNLRAAEEAAKRLRRYRYVGVECQWNHREKPTWVSLMQISAMKEVVIFQFPKTRLHEVPSNLKKLLKDPKIVKCIHDPKPLLALIAKQQDIEIQGAASTRYLGTLFGVKPSSPQALCAMFVNQMLVKSFTHRSNWSVAHLVPTQIMYAANAAYAARVVMLEMLQRYMKDHLLNTIDEALDHSRAVYGNFDEESVPDSCSCGLPHTVKEFCETAGEPKAVLSKLCLDAFLSDKEMPDPENFPLGDLLPTFNPQWRPEGYIDSVHLPHLKKTINWTQPCESSVVSSKVAIKAIHELCSTQANPVNFSNRSLYRGAETLKKALVKEATDRELGRSEFKVNMAENLGQITFSSCADFKLTVGNIKVATKNELEEVIALVALRYIDAGLVRPKALASDA